MKTMRKKTTFWNSEIPLTSKRANFILSRPKEAKSLIDAIRSSRRAVTVTSKHKTSSAIKLSDSELEKFMAL